MKSIYIVLYCISGTLFLIAVLGSGLTRPLFDSISEKTLDASGFKKNYFQAVDGKIDELVYKSKQIELQIEKLRKFFTSEKIDESKYQKEQSAMLEKTFYTPLISMFNFIYRLTFIFISFILLSFGIIFQLMYRSFDLRKRLNRLEKLVLTGSA